MNADNYIGNGMEINFRMNRERFAILIDGDSEYVFYLFIIDSGTPYIFIIL